MLLLIAGVTFFASLLLTCFLFALRVREIETGRRFAPRLRDAADREALHFKDLLYGMHIDLKKVPPLLLHGGHVALLFIAIEFARGARAASLSAHAFADFVSEKRNYHLRQTRSEFLRRMSQRRKGNEEGNGHDEGERVEF